MKKILSLFVVLGQVLIGSYAAADDSQAPSPAEARAATQELQTLRSNVLKLQQQIVEHQATAGLSTPPLFCYMFAGFPGVDKRDDIKKAERDIAFVQSTYDDCLDETKKTELAVELTTLKSTFDTEMAKKTQYESAVAKLISLKAEFESYVAQMQAIAQKVSTISPAAMQESVAETL